MYRRHERVRLTDVGKVVVMWLALMVLLVLSGCAGKLDRVADRATYDAVAPEYRRYVARDAELTDEQKERRFRTIETWGARVGR